MTNRISVPAAESGLVRVFALSMDDTAARALKDTPADRAEIMGAEESLDSTHIEVFALADLGEMALADYLIEGGGVVPAALQADRAKLAALEGWVLILYSGAFGGKAASLLPEPSLTLIGTYPQEGVDWNGGVDLSTPSALPDHDKEPLERKRPSDAAMSGRIATVALLILFAVVGLMVWVGS